MHVAVSKWFASCETTSNHICNIYFRTWYFSHNLYFRNVFQPFSFITSAFLAQSIPLLVPTCPFTHTHTQLIISSCHQSLDSLYGASVTSIMNQSLCVIVSSTSRSLIFCCPLQFLPLTAPSRVHTPVDYQSISSSPYSSPQTPPSSHCLKVLFIWQMNTHFIPIIFLQLHIKCI